MSRSSPLEVLVVVSNTNDFHGWSQDQKVDRYERAVEWHDYVRANKSNIPCVWGTHQVLSHNEFSTVRSMNVLTYRVEDLNEFDELMDRDPLRDVSQYMTWLLSPLEDDVASDLKRLEKLRAELGGEEALKQNISWQRRRTLYANAPDFVGRHQPVAPPNPPRDYSDQDDDKIQILVVGTNSSDSMNWSDAKQLITYEKISWWADYVWMLIHRGQVTHGWNLHDFCDAARLSYRTCGATLLYSVNNLDEFDELYSLDPVRRKGMFWSIILQPISRQEQIDKRRLRQAQYRLRDRTREPHKLEYDPV